MNRANPPVDERLAALPLPLRHLGIDQVLDPAALMDGRLFGGGDCHARAQTQVPRVEGSLLDLGGLPMLVGRATPIDAWELGGGAFSITVCVAGRLDYRDHGRSLAVNRGDVFLNPRIGERLRLGFVSSLNFPIEYQRLQRTLRAMKIADLSVDVERPYLFSAEASSHGVAGRPSLLAFFSYLDQLLLEGRHLPAALALDDQLHRLVALCFLGSSARLERQQRHGCRQRTRWTPRLDDLIDYIRANAQDALTLTDLEEQSHYSARHLQTLFRERFDCTPMQFVRRQRLELARRKLQTASPGDSVSRIARDCGYRHVSNFSADFHRQFGLPPSQMLRGGGGVSCDNSRIGPGRGGPRCCWVPGPQQQLGDRDASPRGQ